MSKGLPTVSATQTDESGFGGFINVRTNTGIKISSKVVDYGLSFPDTTAFTRAGWISYVLLSPR